jgi:alkylated DNA repair dioxygenase AlkB
LKLHISCNLNLFYPENLLPFDGVVEYFPSFISLASSNFYFQKLESNINWQNDVVKLFGKEITTNRKTAWYGSKSFEYTYSNKTKVAIPWNKELIEIKTLLENQYQEEFNSCLLNLYHNGNEGMAWHSDDEKTILPNSTIASLSFGAERRFLFKHKNTQQKIELNLHSGSLLLMKENTQNNWWHSLPKSAKITSTRINLTFRKMKD